MNEKESERTNEHPIVKKKKVRVRYQIQTETEKGRVISIAAGVRGDS